MPRSALGQVIVVGHHPTVCGVVEAALATAGFDLVPPGAADPMTALEALRPAALVLLVAPLTAEPVGELPCSAAPVAFGDIVVDPQCRTVRRGAHNLDLGRREFDALVVLIRNHPRVVTKQFLLETVWDYGGYNPNVVEVAISGLRRKLERHGPRVIQTIKGLGYAVRPDTYR